ncbi:MAG: DUF4221 family protein [Catalinimonas sp.]
MKCALLEAACIALLLLSACKTETSKKLDYRVIEEINISIPDSVNYSFQLWLPLEVGSDRYVAGLADNKIEFFDLSSGQHVYRIDLNLDGPNGVGQVIQFYFHNFDSVFLFSNSDNAIYLIDSTSKIVNKYSVNDALSEISGASSITCFLNKGDRIMYDSQKGELLLRTNPPFDIAKDYRAYKHPYKVSYDIENKSITSFFGVYPDEFLDEGKYYSQDFEIAYCADCPKKVFSFRRSHDLFEVDVNTNKVKQTYGAKSIYIENTFELIPRDSEANTLIRHFGQSPYYGNILYDEDRKLYYRLVGHRTDEGERRNSSIIVLDEDLAMIGEFFLPADKYFINSAQVTSEGIIIYKINDIEDALTYDIISPVL